MGRTLCEWEQCVLCVCVCVCVCVCGKMGGASTCGWRIDGLLVLLYSFRSYLQ